MNRKLFIPFIEFVLVCLVIPTQATTPNTNDSDVLGEWVSVDFVKEINQFDPARVNWQGELSLKGLSFEADSVVWWFFGDNNRRKLTWQPGIAQTTFDRPALYRLKNIGGIEYLFFEWISGDVIERGMKPFYYVLRKEEIKNKYQNTSGAGSSPQSSSGGFTTVTPLDNVDYYDDVRYKDLRKIVTLKSNLIRSLRFNQDTIWPQQAVGNKTIGWLADKTLQSAMNPGLGIRKLHQMGITGKDVNVAIIDQPLYQDHPEFTGKIAAYHDVGCGTTSSMHGPAVASLLVGESCGAAPGAKVYYVAAPSWTKDTAYQAQALEWIIKQNQKLPVGQKIRVVSVSAAPSGPGSPFDKNNEMWDTACRKAEAEGMIVLDCTQHHGFISAAHFTSTITESPASCGLGSPKNPWQHPPKKFAIFVPTCPRTTAEEYDKGDGTIN